MKKRLKAKTSAKSSPSPSPKSSPKVTEPKVPVEKPVEKKAEASPEQLAQAQARLALFRELEQATELLSTISASEFGVRHQRLLGLTKAAVYFAAIRQLDGFREFVEDLERGKRRKKRAAAAGQ